MEESERIANRIRACIRTEILRPVFPHSAREEHPWVGLIGDRDVWIALVVSEPDIIRGAMLLDQIAFEDERF